MKRSYISTAILLCLLFVGCSMLPAQANSAIKSWHGVNGSVLSAVDGCPVEVLNERLTIEVNEFPSGDGFSKVPDASVTAEYTLKNPTEEAVSVRLFFPVGQTPAYCDESGSYGVWVNGAPAQVTRRFSYPRYSVFNVDNELEKLRDGYDETELLQQQTPVTAISFRLNGFTDEAIGKLLYSGTGRIVVYDIGAPKDDSYTELTSDGGLMFSVRPGAICRLAVFGEADGTFSWSFTNVEGDQPLPDAYAEEIDRETLPFVRFAVSEVPEDCPIGPVDWFNAALDEFSALLQYTAPGKVTLTEWSQSTALGDYMEWYEYTLTFAAGQTLVNKVTAPFFPDIDMTWQPYKYEYTYLLSPAAGWASFGGLDVTLKTPYHLLESSLKGFEKTETGLVLHTDGLPDKELTLTLCATDAPKRDAYTVKSTVLMFAFLAAEFLVAAAGIFGIGMLIRKIIKMMKAKKTKPST